ncbi:MULTISPECIES: MerR family transcriptional regulator [unclassified Streptomyces]|uniref:MerR family transcriptional regulator n=1 Tax=unclassified Streptomyces TaxID=2593676 RepID=UPI003369F310
MSYSVGQVAGFAGITVRTLHHYDEIGLLSPSARSRAGHRRYDDADLDRLQQILFYRELGFPLDEVAVLLDDPDVDPQEHLRRQHAVLTERIERLRKMAAAVEHAMEARKMGINLTPEEKFELFGSKNPEAYAEEAERRWGGTDTYAETQRRTAGYTKEDWRQIQAEVADWSTRFAALMEEGEPASGERAMDMAEEHRRHISTWFYECTFEIHRGIGETYVTDERFREFYDSIRPGAAEFLRDAIAANTARHG